MNLFCTLFGDWGTLGYLLDQEVALGLGLLSGVPHLKQPLSVWTSSGVREVAEC